VDNWRKISVVTMLRDQLKDDRDHYGQLLVQHTDKIAKYVVGWGSWKRK